MSLLFGITREPVYSPGKVEHDRAILEDVAELLRERHSVRVLDVATALNDRDRPDLVFAMCQSDDGLALLSRWQRSGVCVVNAAEAIAGCRRESLRKAFEEHGVPQPESCSIRTAGEGELPQWFDGGAWLKRGDVHAVEQGDVRFCRERSEALLTLEDFRCRGIASAVMQRHVPGDVVKFYAAPRGFLRCYVAGERVDEAWIASVDALARRAAGVLGLEVFGGDVVREPSGALCLIDLNDWPSFAACRSDAAVAIVDYLDAQTRLSES